MSELLKEIKAVIGSGWATVEEVCTALSSDRELEIYIALTDTEEFERVNNHYRVLHLDLQNYL
jgi:hypothetical protein